MRDIVLETTGIGTASLQQDVSVVIIYVTNCCITFMQVFFHRAGDHCPQPFQVNTTLLEPCVPLMRMDHFMGNEVTFVFSCIGLAVVPIGECRCCEHRMTLYADAQLRRASAT